jgi:hypothetical protein
LVSWLDQADYYSCAATLKLISAFDGISGFGFLPVRLNTSFEVVDWVRSLAQSVLAKGYQARKSETGFSLRFHVFSASSRHRSLRCLQTIALILHVLGK